MAECGAVGEVLSLFYLGTMTEESEMSFSEALESVRGMASLAHTAIVIFMSQIVENALAEKLTSKMTIPSNSFKVRIFYGYGPLSSFSAKIDMARALEVVDEETFNTLRVVKDIRNAFAHPANGSTADFDNVEIVRKCRKLPGYAKDENCFSLFSDAVASIIVTLDDSDDAKALADAFQELGKTANGLLRTS